MNAPDPGTVSEAAAYANSNVIDPDYRWVGLKVSMVFDADDIEAAMILPDYERHPYVVLGDLMIQSASGCDLPTLLRRLAERIDMTDLTAPRRRP